MTTDQTSELPDIEWLMQTKEMKLRFNTSTWIPLRGSRGVFLENPLKMGRTGTIVEYFACGSAAFPPEMKEMVEKKISWYDLGNMHETKPGINKDGSYSPIEEFNIDYGRTVGVELVLKFPKGTGYGMRLMPNPDLVSALRLTKKGNSWVMAERNDEVVMREELEKDGEIRLIEIKREYLVDYLAARNLELRLVYFRQRLAFPERLAGTQLETLETHETERGKMRFGIRIFNRSEQSSEIWTTLKLNRNDVNDLEDAPNYGAPVSGDEVTVKCGVAQVQAEKHSDWMIRSELTDYEWITHNNVSHIVRGDPEKDIEFITDTARKMTPATELDDENKVLYLFFEAEVINRLSKLKGFQLLWETRQTAIVRFPDTVDLQIGLNGLGHVTVWAQQIARLPAWHQNFWKAHNITPDGKVGKELLDLYLYGKNVTSTAPEMQFFQNLDKLQDTFKRIYNEDLFASDINEDQEKSISRFECLEKSSLFRLAKNINLCLIERMNVGVLKKLSHDPEKKGKKSRQLLQGIVAEHIGEDRAKLMFTPIAGLIDMRNADAHSIDRSKNDPLELAGVDPNALPLHQGEQLIANIAESIRQIEEALKTGKASKNEKASE